MDYAQLILPIPFEGLLEVSGIFPNESLGVASAFELLEQARALAKTIGLDLAEVPGLQSAGYEFGDWYDLMDWPEMGRAGKVEYGPDGAFYVGFFSAIAKFSVENSVAVYVTN